MQFVCLSLRGVSNMPNSKQIKKQDKIAYRKLLSLLKVIDKNAFLYVTQHKYAKLFGTKGYTSLTVLFSWAKTPQGYAYWESIEEQVRSLGFYDE